MKLQKVVDMLNGIAPPQLALPDDRVGLQVGDFDQDVCGIVTTVDVTNRVIDCALGCAANVIIAHHPLIYNPMSHMQYKAYPQSLVTKLIKSGISLFVMHTNFDSAPGGINDSLAERLGVENAEILIPGCIEKLYKLVVFVPLEAVDVIESALTDIGVGTIGNYIGCSFSIEGTGSFIPIQGALPYVGAIGKRETVKEKRLEMQIPENLIGKAIEIIHANHPYEEPVLDLYPLANTGRKYGLGLIGTLSNPISFGEMCDFVQHALRAEGIRIEGDCSQSVQRIAVMGGSGGGDISLAKRKGADVYITGDVKHPQFLEARAIGLNVIDAGHFYTERPGMESLALRLSALSEFSGIPVEYVDDYTQ